MKIHQLITFSFLLLGLLLVSSFSFFWYTSSAQILEEKVLSDFEFLAESKSSHVETYLDQNIERLKLVTSRNKLRDTLFDYNINPSPDKEDTMLSIIASARESVNEIERICVVGLDGMVITSTDSEFCGKDLHSESFFLEGKEEEVIDFIEEKGILKIFITGPFILEGETIGVGITVINTDYLEEIIQSRTGLYETGEILVGIKDDASTIPKFLFDRRFEVEETSEIDLNQTAIPMRAALNKEEKIFVSALDYRGEEVLAVSQFIKEGELGLVAKIDREEIFGELNETLFRVAIFSTIIFIILTSILSYILGNKISQELRVLSKDVNEITKGNLDLSLPKSKITEINSLIQSLNRILASLKLAILRTGVSKSQIGLGEALKAKEKAEEKYELALKGTSDGVWDWDIKTNKVHYSDKWKLMIGYSPKEIKDDFKEFEKNIHPQDKERVLAYIQNYIKSKGKEKFEIEFRMNHKKGHYVPILAKAFLQKDKKGNPIRMVGTHIDMTELKQVQEKYKELFNNINEGVAVYRPFEKGKDFIFVDINKKVEEIDKVKRKDLIGKKVTEVFPGVKKSGIFEKFVKAYKTGKAQSWSSQVYEDKRLGKTKRENYVYKLHSGEIVAVYRMVKINGKK